MKPLPLLPLHAPLTFGHVHGTLRLIHGCQGCRCPLRLWKPTFRCNFTSFSIVDVDNALPFAVKVGWEYGYASSPDALSIGNYYAHTWDWNYYENLSHKLGGNTNGQDLAFSLLFLIHGCQGCRCPLRLWKPTFRCLRLHLPESTNPERLHGLLRSGCR